MEHIHINMQGSTPVVQKNSGKLKELVLNINGTCFLCSKRIQIDNSNEFLENVSLRQIYRFLDMNSRTVLQKGLRACSVNQTDEECQSSLLKNNCDFSVMLCESCATSSKNLMEMIRQHEVMKMLMTHELQVFHQLFMAPEWVPQQSSNLRNPFQDNQIPVPVNSMETRLVEHLRQELKEKCLTKVKTLKEISFPKVKLEQLKTNVPTCPGIHDHVSERPTEIMEAGTSSISIADSCDILGSEMSGTLDLSYIDELISAVPLQSAIQLCSEMCEKNCKKCPSKRYVCSLCHNWFSRRTTARHHLVNIHPEKFFASVMLPHTSEEIFRKCCKRIIKAEIAQAAQKTGTSAKKWAIFCQFCNQRCCNGSYFKFHIVHKHFGIVERKIIKAQ